MMIKNPQKTGYFSRLMLRFVILLVLQFAFGQITETLAQTTKSVTGTVVSAEDNAPLPGVNISIKGAARGTITNIDGKYSVEVAENEILVFSFIGFVAQEVPVMGKSVINIELKDAASDLDEVVVVGYGVQKKKLNTGATVQVKGDNVQRQNTTSPLQALQGQTPGVNITSTSGQPGSGMKVVIRGLGTVGNSSPLYLIDGVGGDIATLNSSDIESIDVLKDAASAAIYGAQAANGVVLITTKSGKEGKGQVTFDAYYGIQNVVRKAKMLNSTQYMTIMDEQALNSGNQPYNWSGIQSIHDANGNIYNTNWIDKMFKSDAKTQSYSLGITGGSATSTYALSLGYMDQEGVVGGADVSNYKRYNFRINSEHKLFNGFLKVGEQVSFIYTDNNGISVGNQYNNTLRGAFGVSPVAPVYSNNNIYDSPYNDTSTSDWYNGDGNPYGAMMTNTNNENKNATFNGNVFAEIEPVKNLKLRTVFGAVYNSSEYRSFTPLYQFSIYNYNNTRTSVSQNMNHGLGMTWTNTATYDWKINDHAFNALLGMEAYRYSGTYLGASNGILKEGFDTWDYAYINNGTASSSTDGLGASGNPHDETRSVSYFGRLGWNLKETYMVNATLRSDGSSRFASGNRFGYFPSVSAGWTISNESFMEGTQSWLNFLKLRLSWGQVGNQNIANYQYLAPMKSSNTHYLFGTNGYDDAEAAKGLATNWGAYPSRLANSSVTWETSEQTNIGLDTYFLNTRLGVNIDLYTKNTKDWLVEAPILATVGAGAPFINGGSVKNRGVELAISWNDRINSDFSYSISMNGAFNKNKVGEIPTEDGIIHGLTNQLYDNTPEFYRAQNGKPIGYFWGYKTNGLFQNEQEIIDWIAAGNGVLQTDVKPGDVRYYDINHDGVINDSDKVDLGNGMPDVTFGFNIGVEYKGFDFSVNASGAAGHQIVQSYRGHTNKYANYTTAILDRWTGEGTSNKIPRVTEQNINWQFSDLFVHDADYLRINNITLGYDFSKLIKSNLVSQARVYAQVQNAFTFTKYDGMDPEIGYGVDGWVSGIDVGYYPRPRTVLLGVSFKF
jgi:TonB-linked SusC/RagA family outer membrane protein